MEANDNDPVQTILDVFSNDVDAELVKKALEASGNNILEAIKYINKEKYSQNPSDEKEGEGEGSNSKFKHEDGSERTVLDTLSIEQQLQEEQSRVFKPKVTSATTNNNNSSSSSNPQPKSSTNEVETLKLQLKAAQEQNQDLEEQLRQAQAEVATLKAQLIEQQQHHQQHSKKPGKARPPFVLKGRWVQFYTIRYEWKYPPGMFPSSRDRVELHRMGQAPQSTAGGSCCVDFACATGSAEGAGNFNNLDVGYYVLKFVVDERPIAVSDPILVGDEVNVTAELSSNGSGGEKKGETTGNANVVMVHCSRKHGGSLSPEDKIELFSIVSMKVIESKLIGSSSSSSSNNNNNVVSSGGSGGSSSNDVELQIAAPRVPGKYEVRYYVKGSRAYSGVCAVTVENNDSLAVCLIPAQGTTFARVVWKCRAFKRSSSDWVGLYPRSAPSSCRCYEYVKGDEGSSTFDLYAHKFGKGDTIIAKFFVHGYSKTEAVMSKEFTL